MAKKSTYVKTKNDKELYDTAKNSKTKEERQKAFVALTYSTARKLNPQGKGGANQAKRNRYVARILESPVAFLTEAKQISNELSSDPKSQAVKTWVKNVESHFRKSGGGRGGASRIIAKADEFDI